MKQGFLWLAAATFLLVIGCGLVADKYQNVANDFLAVLSEVNDLLESVHNGTDAERAVGKIEKLAIRVDELTLRVKKLPPATKETGTLDHDFKAKRDREQNRFRDVQQRLQGKSETALVLQRPMMQFSRAVFDLDFASFDYNSRSLRAAQSTSGGPPSAVSPPARTGPARPPRSDAFQMAREARMRQLAEKYGSNRVAMVRLVELSPAANRTKLFDAVRASAKVRDTSMTISPDELTIFLAPVNDLQVVARQIPFGKVTQLDARARTITVSMKPQ